MLRLIILSLAATIEPPTIEPPGPRHSFRVNDRTHDLPTLDIGIVRSLGLLPPFITHVAVHADGHSKRPVSAPSAPRPSGTLSDRQVIPSEAEPPEREAHQGAEDDVPAVMSEIGIAGRGNVNGGADRNERNHQEVGRRRSGLVTQLNRGRCAGRLTFGRMRWSS